MYGELAKIRRKAVFRIRIPATSATGGFRISIKAKNETNPDPDYDNRDLQHKKYKKKKVVVVIIEFSI